MLITVGYIAELKLMYHHYTMYIKYECNAVSGILAVLNVCVHVLQRAILRVFSPDGPSSHQPLRQPRVPQRGTVRCHGNRPPLPVSPRLRGRALRNACQCQLCQPRVLPAASLQSPLPGDQHQPTGVSSLFRRPAHCTEQTLNSHIFLSDVDRELVSLCASPTRGRSRVLVSVLGSCHVVHL